VYRRIQGTIDFRPNSCGDFIHNFDFTANDFGLYFFRDRAFTKTITFYYGFAFLYRIRDQQLIPTLPTTETEVKNQFRPVLDIGVRVSIWTKKPMQQTIDQMKDVN